MTAPGTNVQFKPTAAVGVTQHKLTMVLDRLGRLDWPGSKPCKLLSSVYPEAPPATSRSPAGFKINAHMSIGSRPKECKAFCGTV